MGTLARSLFVWAALGAGACAPAGRGDVHELVGHVLVEQALDVARIETIDAPAAALGASRERVLVREPGRCQGVEFARGAQALVLVTYAAGPDAAEVRTELDAGFALDAVAARRGDELFVAGRSRDGRTRIERWTVGDGTVAARETLFDDISFGGVRLLACDLDGRCVIALAESGAELVQVPLDGLPPSRYPAARAPALRDANAVFCAEHVGGERVFAFEAAGNAARQRAVFVDRDADGSFDDVFEVDARGWSELGYDGAVWLREQLVTAR